MKGELLSPQTSKAKPAGPDEARDMTDVVAQFDPILGYLATNLTKQQELIEALASNKTIIKLVGFQRYAPTAADHSAFMSKVGALLTADAASKKPALVEFKKAMSTLNPLNTKELQTKYDQLRAAKEETALHPSGLLAESAIISSNKALSTRASALNPEGQSISATTLTAWEAMARLSGALRGKEINDSEFIGFQKLIKEIGSFHNVFQSAIEASRDKLLIVSPPEFLKMDFEPDLAHFQQTLDAIKARNSEYERFAYSKLSELRAQNNQLKIVQNHINR